MLESQKHEFRNLCIDRLKFVSRLDKNFKDKKIVQRLYKTILNLDKKNILLYIPMGIEVNVAPLINKLRKEKKFNVYVPFIIGETFKAVPYRLPLKVKKFGIKEPNFSFKNVNLDVAIVPVVGIDGANKRIGFGKGMYDRFFWKMKKKPTIIFTQKKLCKTTQILSNNYDIKADIIICG